MKDIAIVLDIDVIKLIGENINLDNSNANGVSKMVDQNSHVDKLINSLGNQVELLKEQNYFFKNEIIAKNTENKSLRNTVLELKKEINALKNVKSNFQI